MGETDGYVEEAEDGRDTVRAVRSYEGSGNVKEIRVDGARVHLFKNGVRVGTMNFSAVIGKLGDPQKIVEASHQ